MFKWRGSGARLIVFTKTLRWSWRTFIALTQYDFRHSSTCKYYKGLVYMLKGLSSFKVMSKDIYAPLGCRPRTAGRTRTETQTIFNYLGVYTGSPELYSVWRQKAAGVIIDSGGWRKPNPRDPRRHCQCRSSCAADLWNGLEMKGIRTWEIRDEPWVWKEGLRLKFLWGTIKS